MRLVTTQQYVSRLAGPQKMRRHATDDVLGRSVTLASGETGQVWCAAHIQGYYWVATGSRFVDIHESFILAQAEDVAS